MALLSGAIDTPPSLAGGDCRPVRTADEAADLPVALDSEQLANASIVVSTAEALGLPPQAAVVGLATALQESGLRVLTQAESDRDSAGIFQQRPSQGWGSVEQVMDPVYASQRFYTALRKVPGWESLPVTVAAQRVQRSAFPTAYVDDEATARQLLSQLGSGADGSTVVSAVQSTVCASYVDGSPVQYPLPATSGYQDLGNYGGDGPLWSNGHTGTDFSVACGTPVLAATSGTVLVETDQSWSGRWLVQVSTSEGELTTWYAHMQAVTVQPGATVHAGQQIGEVGSEGNSTGCHLHFEVHPHGGSIYEDDIDPTPWLAEHVGNPLPQIMPITQTTPAGQGFVLATFNTLGASHTDAGGNKPWYASGTARTRSAVQLLGHYGVDVAGLQEFQRPQWHEFASTAGGTYAIYPGPHNPQNAIVWRRSAFQLVSASTVRIPYFHGHMVRMPVVRLRERATGQTAYFINVHNPATTKRRGNQTHWRRVATRREIALTHRLHQLGDPVFLTGDLNEHAEFFCRYTASGVMHAAAGGSNTGACNPPPDSRAHIDWIFGSQGVTFSAYTKDRGAFVQRTADHPLVLTRALLLAREQRP